MNRQQTEKLISELQAENDHPNTEEKIRIRNKGAIWALQGALKTGTREIKDMISTLTSQLRNYQNQDNHFKKGAKQSLQWYLSDK